MIEHWCLAHKGQLLDHDSDKPCIPAELWKCLRLDCADEDFLTSLLAEELTLCLSSSQLRTVGKAAVALRPRAADTSYSFVFYLRKPMTPIGAIWVEHLQHGKHSWYTPGFT